MNFQHFIDGHPTDTNPSPIPADTSVPLKRGRKPPRERSTCPSKKKRLNSDTSTTIDPDSHIQAAETLVNLSQPSSSSTKSEHEATTEAPAAATPIKIKLKRHLCKARPPAQPPGTTVTYPSCKHKFLPTGKERKSLQRKAFIDEITQNDPNCFMYTGVTKTAMLVSIYNWILPAASKIKLWDGTGDISNGRPRSALTLYEEMLLTLVRIRRGYDTRHVAYLFGVSQSVTSKIFLSWCKLLANALKHVLVWPSKELVSHNMPESFQLYPRTRVIIDTTEFHVEKPFRSHAQKLTWSNYKHANTFKLLVGIMPSGAITFLSRLYSGCISDMHITEQSGLLNKLDEGDDVMADRGFNIRHLLLTHKCTLNIPAFSHGKRLSMKGVKRSRRIASVRIHVERAIRRMKTFKLISGVIPLKLRFSMDNIITIVAALCNLQPRLA